MLEQIAWRDRLISFRALVCIILAIGAIRLVIAFILPNDPSALAPDEGTYAELAWVIRSGGDWASWSSGWGVGLYPASRALLTPAATLIYVGLDDLTAVRVTSVLYAVGSQLLLLSIARLARHRLALETSSGLRLAGWPLLGMAVFVLMPSNALWSNLGLREAACAFWVLGAITSAAYLFATQDWRWKVGCGLGIAVSISMAFQSRSYLAAALVLGLAVGVIWLGKEQPRFSVILLLTTMAGAVLGVTLSMPTGTTTPPASPEQIAQAEEFQAQAEALEEQSAPLRLEVEAAGESSLLAWTQGVGDLAGSAINPATYLDRASNQRKDSAQYAKSAIAVESCVAVPGAGSLRWCEISRLPGAAFAVMFRPLWPLDVPSEWSGMAVMASIENLAWLALVGAVVWVLVTRCFKLTRVLTVSLAYGALVIAGMAALEGNLGTAFRHKSSTLWVLCIVLVLAGASRFRARKADPPTVTPSKTTP